MEAVLAGPGTTLAERYTLERELGRGGTATVFLAHDLKHHRQVAVKILRPQLAASVGTERFLREIEIAAHLTHPNILPLHDSGEAEGLVYYVMPFVEGETLRERLRREGPLSVDEALRICREVADALAYAHRCGVVHRDIKPANILLQSGHAVVADFGIARAFRVAVSQEITSGGMVVGTPMYMSPEQASGGPVDGRSDIYALGCVLYEMLAGEPPFSGETPQNVAGRHLHQPPPLLRLARPSVSVTVEQAVATALAKLPGDRFPDAERFAAALTLAGPLTPIERPARASRVRPVMVAAALAAVAVAAWLLGPEPVSLDPNRVVVFPFRGPSPVTVSRGADASLALVASLNTTSSLTGIDGGRLGAGTTPPSLSQAGRLTRQQHAAYYLDATLLASDSLRLLLDLHDLRDGAVTHRVVALPASSDGWSVGVRAALELLPVLIRTGRPAELPSLTGHSPAAMAEFFLGERSYRTAAFADALEHFRRAVALDSSFGIAALRGAQAASWNRRTEEAGALVAVALADEAALPLRQREFARGLQAWMGGRADSAVRRFRNAIALDPDAAEPWMGLGETYNHLIPSEASLDSLAEQAFTRVRELDSTFAPVLFHLIEFAVRRGEYARAADLLARYRSGTPDPEELGTAELMLDCARNRMSQSGWRSAVHNAPAQVIAAAQSLALGGLRQPACAREAWEALVRWDTTTGDLATRYRFGALLGLHSLLTAEGRQHDVGALLEGDNLIGSANRGQLYLLGVLAGGGSSDQAESYAERTDRVYRAGPTNLSAIELWFLGSWAAFRGRAAEADEIANLLLRRAEGGSPRRDSLLAASVRARATLARGDSAGALQQLAALQPNTPSHQDLTWNPWESLGGERLLRARLLLARGLPSEAQEVASGFDSPVPISYIMFLPASLSIRMQAAERLGDARLARACRDRLAALRAGQTRAK
jgi:tRNA A-37 threonylcarbamoyl transferase component Bud32/tetratricopeptide (TPR) repeat protein